MAAAYTSSESIANAIAERTEMITSRMDEIIAKEIKTSGMTADSALIEATQNAGEVKLGTISSSGLGNYSEEDGYQFGKASLVWNSYALKHDRGVVLDVDRRELMESGQLASTAAFAAYLTRNHINPEIDATRLSGIYAAVNGNSEVNTTNLVTEDLTAAGVLSAINKGIDRISEVWSVDSGYTIYISSAIKSLLRSSTEYTKTKSIDAGSTRLSTDVTEIDGNSLVWVPSARMKTAYDYNDIDAGSAKDGGFTPSASAQDINFVIVAPGVANGIVSINAEKIITKEVNQRKDADSLYVRVFHDVIVPKNAAVGAYVSVANAARSEMAEVQFDDMMM